jgi:hypothetical protein
MLGMFKPKKKIAEVPEPVEEMEVDDIDQPSTPVQNVKTTSQSVKSNNPWVEKTEAVQVATFIYNQQTGEKLDINTALIKILNILESFKEG